MGGRSSTGGGGGGGSGGRAGRGGGGGRCRTADRNRGRQEGARGQQHLLGALQGRVRVRGHTRDQLFDLGQLTGITATGVLEQRCREGREEAGRLHLAQGLQGVPPHSGASEPERRRHHGERRGIVGLLSGQHAGLDVGQHEARGPPRLRGKVLP